MKKRRLIAPIIFSSLSLFGIIMFLLILPVWTNMQAANNAGEAIAEVFVIIIIGAIDFLFLGVAIVFTILGIIFWILFAAKTKRDIAVASIEKDLK